jgi:hypothetical protein
MVVQNKILGARTASPVTRALLLAACLAVGNAAVAGPSEEGGSHPPDRAGPYAIGHTTVVITEPVGRDGAIYEQFCSSTGASCSSE